jgi:hypothetical protein
LVFHPAGRRWVRLFRNKVLRRIFEELREGQRNYMKRNLIALCSSLNIVNVIKSTRMRWMGHAERIRKIGNLYRTLICKIRREVSNRET